MVGDPSWTNESLISGLTRLIKENGLLSTFEGLSAMLSKQVTIDIPTLSKVTILIA